MQTKNKITMKGTALILAPYYPSNRGKIVHLGAARKIEAVATALSNLDYEVVLLNSAYKEYTAIQTSPFFSQEGMLEIDVGRRKGSVGALFGLNIDYSTIYERLAELGPIEIVWSYNAYLAEMQLAKKLKRLYPAARFILELEDWHFARSRGINPKPFIDFAAWTIYQNIFETYTVVNHALLQRLHKKNRRIHLFPGIISRQALDCVKRTPFSDSHSQITIGYFGGLSIEKGADKIMGIVSRLKGRNPLFRFIITGAGELASDLAELAHKHPELLQFLGQVDNDSLFCAINQCDIIINPHQVTNKLLNGVLPFKLLEAIATSRLVVSTAVDTQGIEEMVAGVIFVDGSIDSFVQTIVGSVEIYDEKREIITRSSAMCADQYGEKIIGRILFEA